MAESSDQRQHGPAAAAGRKPAGNSGGADERELAGNSGGEGGWRGQPCPLCKKMPVHEYRPFCSRRCADVDLARWLGGTYAIPAGPADEAESD